MQPHPKKLVAIVTLLVVSGLLNAAFTPVAYSAPQMPEPPSKRYLMLPDLPSPSLQRAEDIPLWKDPRRLALSDEDAARRAEQGTSPAPGTEVRDKSYLIPAAEVPSFLVLLNIFDRLAFPNKKKDGKHVYDTTPKTFWDHLTEQNWTFDKDDFDVNQFGHPYEGATMYGLARSAGLDFWTSLLYSNVGSFLWEMGGERSQPSINDIITTGNAGSLFGEALFRMANLVLEEGGNPPGFWHEVSAALISPANAFNRHAFDDRFKTVYPGRHPVTLWLFNAGVSTNTHLTKPIPTEYHDDDAVASFAMEYGLPGKPGYRYRRPFDYFAFDFATRLRVSNLIEALSVRGLLWGRDYQAGENYRGIWGLYGSYDYLAPYLYRTSSTALSLGTTAHYWLAPGVALRGTFLAGFGYGAAGTDTETVEERGYHYGATPQGLLALNLVFGDRVMLDATGRAYYVSDVASDHPVGADFIFQGNAGITFRVTGRHAVSLRYVESIRDTNYYNLPDRHFSQGTISFVYTFLSDPRFGAVEWREAARR